MAEVMDIVLDGIISSNMFSDKVDEMTIKAQELFRLDLTEAMDSYTPKTDNYKRTGQTRSSILSKADVNGLNATITVYLDNSPEWNIYVDENSIWGGHHFFDGGLRRFMEEYE